MQVVLVVAILYHWGTAGGFSMSQIKIMYIYNNNDNDEEKKQTVWVITNEVFFKERKKMEHKCMFVDTANIDTVNLWTSI